MFHEVVRCETRENDRVLMLDIDLGTEEYSDESSEFPVLAAIKQGIASQKRGMKMKDRYFCLVLLVGQAYWKRYLVRMTTWPITPSRATIPCTKS